MTTKEIEDELYRMLSDVVNGGYPKRTYAQQARYKEAVKRTIDALDILEQMSNSEKPNKWIPISERLPEDKTYVLTTIKVPNRIAHVRSGWYESGFFYNDNGDIWKATDREVKAWLPLPLPYMAESEDKE